MSLLPSNSADPTPTIIIDIGRQEAFKQKKIKSQNYSRNFPSIIYNLGKKALEQCEGLGKKKANCVACYVEIKDMARLGGKTQNTKHAHKTKRMNSSQTGLEEIRTS